MSPHEGVPILEEGDIAGGDGEPRPPLGAHRCRDCLTEGKGDQSCFGLRLGHHRKCRLVHGARIGW